MPTNEDSAKDIFDKLKQDSPFRGKGKMTWEKAENAADWYRKSIRRLGGFTAEDALEELKHKLSPSISIGKMFIYRYDAKWKDILPVWDAFPLVIPIELYGDGFLGLNLHYLAPEERLYLLHRLLEFATDRRMDQHTSLVISYGFLKAIARYKAASPCIHRYLGSHIMSNIIQIDAPEWEMAVFLPIEQFRKKSKASVWKSNRSTHRKKRK